MVSPTTHFAASSVPRPPSGLNPPPRRGSRTAVQRWRRRSTSRARPRAVGHFLLTVAGGRGVLTSEATPGQRQRDKGAGGEDDESRNMRGIRTRTRWHRDSVALVLRDMLPPGLPGAHPKTLPGSCHAHHNSPPEQTLLARQQSKRVHCNQKELLRLHPKSRPRMLCLHIPSAAFAPTCSSTPACTSAADARNAQTTTARAADPGRRAAPGHQGSTPKSP